MAPFDKRKRTMMNANELREILDHVDADNLPGEVFVKDRQGGYCVWLIMCTVRKGISFFVAMKTKINRRYFHVNRTRKS